jgi:transcriptional regulator with XRE-family HTH domain
MAMLNRSFWENVKNRRTEMNILCKTVDEYLGVSEGYYYNLERRYAPSIDDRMLAKLMTLLNTSIKDMLSIEFTYMYSRFWGNLNTVCKRKKITIQTIADRLGVTRQTFYDYRRIYAESITANLAQQIAAIVDEPLENLLGLREMATEGYTTEELLFLASDEAKEIIRQAMAKQRVG